MANPGPWLGESLANPGTVAAGEGPEGEEGEATFRDTDCVFASYSGVDPPMATCIRPCVVGEKPQEDVSRGAVAAEALPEIAGGVHREP